MIRHTLLFLFILLFNVSFGQNFAPFNDTISKRFNNVTNLADINDYFFYSIDTIVSGNTIQFTNYHLLSDSSSYCENDCPAWGSGPFQYVDTLWLGRNFQWNYISNQLLFKNKISENVQFDFNLQTGDSSLIYQNSTNKYYLKLQSNQFESFLDTSDTVKTFEIFHYNDLNNIVNSPLNNFEIKLSKKYGLLSFINTYHFPNIETGYVLKGQTQPTIGYYQLTYDEIFPWNNGDTIQIKGQFDTQYQGFSYIYRTISITNRTESIDSVWIFFTEVTDTFFSNNIFSIPTFTYGYNNPISFKKNKNISRKPKKIISNNYISHQSETYICGTKKYYTLAPNLYTGYCDSCNNYIPIDGNNGFEEFKTSYVESLGKYSVFKEEYGSTQSNVKAFVIYSNINGERCGVFHQTASLSENSYTSFSISPNPASKNIKIESDFEMSSISIFNIYGEEIYSEKKNTLTTTIDVKNYSAGIYFVQIKDSNGNYGQEKLIIE